MFSLLRRKTLLRGGVVMLVAGFLAGASCGLSSSAPRQLQASITGARVFIAAPSSAGLGTNGSDSDSANCKRFADPVSAPPGGAGSGCASFQRAYQLAQPGDTVYLNWSGAWATTQKLGPSGSKTSGSCTYPNLSGCITFKPAPGMTPSITPTGAGGVKICANQVALDGLTFNASTGPDGYGNQISNVGWGIGKGDSTCQPNGSPPHDIFIHSVTSNDQVGISGGAYNVYVLGGTVGHTVNVSMQSGAAGNSGQTAPVHNVTWDGVLFTGMTWTDPTHHHPACLHVDFASDRQTIENSRFEGCRTFAIRVEAEGSNAKNANSQTNLLIQNNFFDGAPLNFDCHNNGCVLTGNTVRFNTIRSGVSLTNDCALTAGNSCTASSNVLYGNIIFGSCPPSSAIYAGGWSEHNNVWTGSLGGICTSSGGSAFNVSPSFVSPTDYHLATCSQKAADFVPSNVAGGYPATDIDGDLLPTRSLAAAGADQCDTALMVFGRSIGSAKLGEKEADVIASYGRPRTTGIALLGKQRLRRLVYRFHSGYLRLFENSDRVIVGIGTTSPYYTTAGGIGVGTDTAGVRSWSSLTWADCHATHRKRFGAAAVYVTPAGGRKGKTIGSVLMIRSGYSPCVARS